MSQINYKNYPEFMFAMIAAYVEKSLLRLSEDL